MTKPKHYHAPDITADPDDKEVSEEAAKHPMTFAEAHPELAASIRRARGSAKRG